MSTAHRQYSRKFAAIVTVLALVLALFPVAAFAQEQPTFKDIAGLKLAPEIEAAAKAGLVQGYPDGTFRPKNNVTRAEFAKMVVLAVEKGTGKSLEKGDEPFSDVREGQALYEYVVKAYKAGYIQGYEDGTFGYDKPIVREEAAAILQRALGLQEAEENFDDVSSDMRLAGAIGAVAKAGIMKGYDEKHFGPRDNVARDQAAATAVRAYNYLVEKNAKYEVVSVAAVSSKSLKVTFNKAVQDTSAVKFDVKRDGITVTVTPTWADDKKSVELTSAAKLLAGTYTVTVSGLDFAEGKNSGSVKVEDEKVAKIELLGDKLIRGKDPKEATIPYRVFNQYGEDITKSALASDIQWAASVGDESVNQPGILTLTSNDTNGWKVGDKVVVTGVDRATGVSTSKTLTVAEASGLSSFAFGKVIYPENTTRIYKRSDSAAAAWIEVSATDENGNPVDAGYLEDAVELFASNNVEAKFVAKDGKPVVELTTQNAIPGKVNITAVVLVNPDLNKTITVEVVDQPYAAKVDLGAFDGVLAVNDPQGTLVVPLTVYNQFGEVMSAKDVAALGDNDLRFSVVGVDNLTVGVAKEGDNLGKVINTGSPSSEGYATITVVAVRTGDSDTIRVQVRPQRKPAELVVPSNITKNLLFGATASIQLGLKDQYGASFDPAKQSLPSGASFKYNVVASSLDYFDVRVGNNNVDADGVQGTSLTDLKNITVTAKDKAGSATVTVQLLEHKSGKDVVVSEVSFSLTVAKATSSLQYSIAEIPALYRDADGDGTAEGATESPGAYAERVKIVAKDNNGNTYAVNPASIVSFTVSSTKFGIGDVDSNTPGVQLGVWSQATSTDLANGDIKGTITVTFNTADGGILTLQAPVTISAAARTPVNLHVRSVGLGSAATELPESSVVKKVNVSLATGSLTVDSNAHILVEDQFGRFWAADSSVLTIGIANRPQGLNASVSVGAQGKVSISGLSGAKKGDTFDVVFLTSNGKTATLAVEVVD